MLWRAAARSGARTRSAGRRRRAGRIRGIAGSGCGVTRRARGDGGLRWDETPQRWIAEITIGYDGRDEMRSHPVVGFPMASVHSIALLSAISERMSGAAPSAARTRDAWPMKSAFDP
jgi:hypothetical protein